MKNLRKNINYSKLHPNSPPVRFIADSNVHILDLGYLYNKLLQQKRTTFRQFSTSPCLRSDDESDQDNDRLDITTGLDRKNPLYFEEYSSKYGDKHRNDWFNGVVDNTDLNGDYSEEIDPDGIVYDLNENRCKIIEEFQSEYFESHINLKPVSSDDIFEPNTLNEVNKIILNIHEELKFMADELIQRRKAISNLRAGFEGRMVNWETRISDGEYEMEVE